MTTGSGAYVVDTIRVGNGLDAVTSAMVAGRGRRWAPATIRRSPTSLIS